MYALQLREDRQARETYGPDVAPAAAPAREPRCTPRRVLGGEGEFVGTHSACWALADGAWLRAKRGHRSRTWKVTAEYLDERRENDRPPIFCGHHKTGANGAEAALRAGMIQLREKVYEEQTEMLRRLAHEIDPGAVQMAEGDGGGWYLPETGLLVSPEQEDQWEIEPLTGPSTFTYTLMSIRTWVAGYTEPEQLRAAKAFRLVLAEDPGPGSEVGETDAARAEIGWLGLIELGGPPAFWVTLAEQRGLPGVAACFRAAADAPEVRESVKRQARLAEVLS